MEQEYILEERYKGKKITVEKYIRSQYKWRINGTEKTGIATSRENAMSLAKKYIDNR